MKTKLSIVVIALLTAVCFSMDVSAQSQEIVIQTAAQCGECKTNIEKALMAENGVRFAELDIETKKAKVVYNPKKISPEKLRTVISMIGYDADDVPADSAAVLKLNPCCTKEGHRDH